MIFFTYSYEFVCVKAVFCEVIKFFVEALYSMEQLPIDYFNNNFEVFAQSDFGQLPVADGFEENIRRAISDIQHSHIALGYALIAYAESHTFGFFCYQTVRDCRSDVFFARCASKFNLDKSSVSRHVNVVYRFGNGEDGLCSSFRNRSFSYLCELLPLSEQDIDHCLIHCNTVAEIRAYKKTLVATSQQENKPKSDNFETLESFSIYRDVPSDRDKSDYAPYHGIYFYSLIDELIRYKSKCRDLERELNMLRSSLDIKEKPCDPVALKHPTFLDT